MKSTRRAVVAVCLIMAMLWSSVAPVLADGITDRANLPDILVNPLLFFLLQEDEAAHKDKVLLTVDDLRFQTTVSADGNLAGVGMYRPLDTSVNISGLFYQRDLNNQQVTLRLDTDGYSSRNMDARLLKPNSYWLRVRDQRVFHRLFNDQKVDVNLTPTQNWNRTWQSTQTDLDVSVVKDGNAGVYGGYWFQKRGAFEGHSFYQLHRFNCTECHSVGYTRDMGGRTEDYYGGVRATAPWQGATFDAQFRTSRYTNTGPSYAWNFGGTLGTSTLYPTVGSRDNWQEYRLYVGQGGPYRVGAHLTNLDRRNQSSGQGWKGQYLSVAAQGQPARNLSLMASYYGQKEDNSLQTNLSNSKQRMYLNADYQPFRGLNLSGRFGFEDRSYRLLGLSAPRAQDTYWQLRGDWRPTREFRLEASYRNDVTDHPFFYTDLANKTTFYTQATFNRGPFSLGARYNSVHGSNSVNDFAQDEFLAFLSAKIDRASFNTAYTASSINSNNSFNYFLPMPTATAAQISPGIGGPLFLQSGFPYSSKNNQFQATLNLPIGGKTPFLLSPMYRWARTDTTAAYLPMFPAVTPDSQMKIVQNAVGFRLDLPAWNNNERLGLGWEFNRWKDEMSSSRTGSYNIFTINFNKRY